MLSLTGLCISVTDDEPISKLELWQFSLVYDDLPIKEGVADPVDNGIYRSRRNGYIYIYHKINDRWDCFVAG